MLWSILAKLNPNFDSKNGHAERVSNYRQYFNELNIEGFDFTNGFKCSVMHKFEKVNNLSINIFEINFYLDDNKWKQKLIPLELHKDKTDKVKDSLIYKNQ